MYPDGGCPLQEYVIADPTEATMGLMPTIYMNARLVGLSAPVAYAVQAIVAAAAAAAVTWTFWRRRDPLLSYALLLAAGLAATPYLMSYDLVVIVWAMLALVASGRFTRASGCRFSSFTSCRSSRSPADCFTCPAPRWCLRPSARCC